MSDKKIHEYFKILKEEVAVSARKEAIKSILALDEKVFLNYVNKALYTEKDIEILAYMAEMVVKKRIKNGEDLLIPLLKSSEPMLRSHICGLLSNYSNDMVLDVLLERLIKDDHVDVRLASIYALGVIGNKKAIKELTWVKDHDFSNDQVGWSVSERASLAIDEIKQKNNL